MRSNVTAAASGGRHGGVVAAAAPGHATMFRSHTSSGGGGHPHHHHMVTAAASRPLLPTSTSFRFINATPAAAAVQHQPFVDQSNFLPFSDTSMPVPNSEPPQHKASQ